MTKKGNLSVALNQFDKRPDTHEEVEAPLRTEPEVNAAPKKGNVASAEVEVQGKVSLPPSRQGKKALTGYFDPEVLRQLKVMAATEDTTVQALMSEALNDLFKKYGKPHIA